MVSRLPSLKKNTTFWTVILSLAVHIILLWKLAPIGNVFPVEDEAQAPPIIFDLMQQPRQKQMREFVEAPENAIEEQPDNQDTHLLSNKTLKARNDAPEDVQLGDSPYSEGSTNLKSIASPMPGSHGMTKETSNETSDPSNEDRQEPAEFGEVQPQEKQNSSSFKKSMLTGGASGLANPLMDQRKSKVEHKGGVTLSTYAWEWAPYVRSMLNRLRNNNYPPPVYTRLGQGGRVVYQYRIHRDGSIEGPGFIRNIGEKSLIETARRAIVLSAPFAALPENFPEPHLDIVITFEY
ncbi:hypothetical protein KAR48_18945 [bacterium]|nr:hypothetical protein [bacterium]